MRITAEKLSRVELWHCDENYRVLYDYLSYGFTWATDLGLVPNLSFDRLTPGIKVREDDGEVVGTSICWESNRLRLGHSGKLQQKKIVDSFFRPGDNIPCYRLAIVHESVNALGVSDTYAGVSMEVDGLGRRSGSLQMALDIYGGKYRFNYDFLGRVSGVYKGIVCGDDIKLFMHPNGEIDPGFLRVLTKTSLRLDLVKQLDLELLTKCTLAINKVQDKDVSYNEMIRLINKALGA